MEQERRNQGGLWVGLFLIAVGVLFLLDQMNVFGFAWVFRDWWPSLLILFGVVRLLTCRGRRVGPFVLIVIGVILQGQMLHWFWWWHMGRLWPLILIAVGLGILLKRMQGGSLAGPGSAPFSR